MFRRNRKLRCFSPTGLVQAAREEAETDAEACKWKNNIFKKIYIFFIRYLSVEC